MEKVNVTCRVPKDRVATLDKYAALTDRDRSYVLNEAIDLLIAHHQWQIDEVERAIAEVEAGNCLTEKEFLADMRTWRRQN